MRFSTTLSAVAAFVVLAAAAEAAPCSGVNFAGGFAGNYTCNSLGTPGGVPSNLGGIAFLDNDTLLVGGSANQAGGKIYTIDVTRDANNHITGFAGPATLFATAPYIDGGLAFGPGGVLFFTGYPNNTLGQIKPGSTTPDKIVTLPSGLSSVGTLAFVPEGFAGAGQLKIASYSNGRFYTATLSADGSGTYNVDSLSAAILIGGGPEGIVYVDGANEGFGVDGMLIAEYGAGKIAAYDIDANGDPIVSSRRDFITGLSGAEGALIDPLTNDFLFSTFGGGNQIVVVQGFEAPPPTGVPEPATLVLLAGGLAGLGALRRRKA